MDDSKQRTMVTKSSSIKRKPLANLTNIVRKPYPTSSFLQSKKPVSSTASDSGIGYTQNPIIVVPPDQPPPSKSHGLTPDHLTSNENQTAQAQRHSTRNTRSNTKVAVPFHQTSFQERTNNVKQGSVSFCSLMLDKIKDLGKINQSSTEKIKDIRKSTDVPLSSHLLKNTNNITDKGKENVVQSNTGPTMLDDLMKRKDKEKTIAEPIDYPSKKMLKYNMMDFNIPLKGVVIKERDSTVTGSGSVNLAQKDKRKEVSTPIKYQTLKKKDQQISCPPILRTMNNRNDAADGIEAVLQSKLQSEPPPNKKKRRCSAKEVNEEYTLTKEFVEQQRAYFKEIDEFELLVEEV